MCPLFCCMVQGTYEKKIKDLIEPLIEAEGMELILVECHRMKTRWLVRLYLDKEGGITVDDCAAISNQVGDVLDVYDLPPGPYTLEVSSPGLNRPLSRDKDFLKFRGSEVSLRLEMKIEGARNFRGRLVDLVEEEGKKVVYIEVQGKMMRIPRELIKKAHLEYEF